MDTYEINDKVISRYDYNCEASLIQLHDSIFTEGQCFRALVLCKEIQIETNGDGQENWCGCLYNSSIEEENHRSVVLNKG